MKQQRKVNILMNKTVKGSVELWPMVYEAGKVYETDESMARQFLSMGVCAISVIPETGCYVAHNLPGAGPTWVLIPKAT